ncbi:MAG: class I SAM-dependent methyltransferase [Acidobacteriota bacterium]
MLICPKCGASLEPTENLAITCACGETYHRLSSGGLDFLQGSEFDDFDLDEEDITQRAILEQEAEGVAARMDHFFSPLIHRYALFSRKPANRLTILDCGCGNGITVDILREHGIDAWGVDAGRARHQQWCQRRARAQLISANALRLPFADAAFDVVFSSGLVEHIGIHEEEEADGYHSRRLADCDQQRQQFVRELVRVLKDDGFILLDHPNGSFPADFWHGGEAGSIRWHWPHGDMLPRFSEIVRYFRLADSSLKFVSLSPSRRLSFNKVGVHWYGRLFAPMMKAWLHVMDIPQLSFLARTFLNPYLVTVATKRRDLHTWVTPQPGTGTTDPGKAAGPPPV